MSSYRTTRYLDVLALPLVPLTFCTALVGRSAYALVFLPLLYAVSDATGSIALAGTAVATYGATASFLAPGRAWLIDRYGARPVLAVLTLAFSAAITAIATTSLLGGGGAAFIALAGVTGAVAPPLGPTMRVAWGSLTPDGDLLRKGLSLDAVMEELLYLAGPAVSGVALTVVSPGQALYVPAALVAIGGLLFAFTPTVGSMRSRPPVTANTTENRSVLRRPQFVAVLLPVVVTGTIFGAVSIAVPVALADHGGSTAAGIALGLFAGGSAVGGLLYGALRVPGSPITQLIALAAALLAATSLIAVVTGAVAVSAALALSGMFFSPVMIVAYLAAHSAGGDRNQNAATTWVNTSLNVGSAIGGAVTGILVQAAGVSTAIGVLVAVAVVLLAITAQLTRPRGPQRA